MRPVLVLRPEPGASATADRARELGLDALAMPLFEVEPVAWEAPDPNRFDAVLLTSANAVRHGGEGLRELRGLPAYAVGEATAAAAREARFDVASIGEGGVKALLEEAPPELKLLHLCSADRAEPEGARQSIMSIVVYRSRELADPGAIPGDCVALIHSPRAGRRFAELARRRAGIAIAAISPTAAEAASTGWESVRVADRPTDDALLALAASLCNNRAAG